MKLTTAKKRWIASLAIWAVFIASIAGFSSGYRWLKNAWIYAFVLAVFATAVNLVIESVRHKGDPNAMWYRGYPQWFLRFVFDQDAEQNAGSTSTDRQR